MENFTPENAPSGKKQAEVKTKIYDLPRKEVGDISPAGITYVREKSFAGLSPEAQTAVKRKEITLDDAWEKEFGKFEGSYSTPFSSTIKEKITEAISSIEEQNDLSKQIFSKLEVAELKNFRNAVSLHFSLGKNLDIEKKNDSFVDRPTISNIYGDVDTILRLNESFLSKIYNLEQLHQEARRLEQGEEKKNTANKYARDLAVFAGAQGHDIDTIEFNVENVLSVELESELRDIFLKNNPAKWHNVFLSNKNISDEIKLLILKKIQDYQQRDNEGKKKADPRHTGELTESFLSLLNPDKKPEQIGEEIYFKGHKFKIYEIFSKKDLKKESDVLGHCLGNSNTYFHAIRNGDMKVLSIQDQNNNPIYTIAYNPRDNSISQFRSENNTPINPQLNSAEFPLLTLNILENNGLKISSIKESLDYNLAKVDGIIQSLDNLDISDVLNFIKVGQENRVIKSKTLKPGEHTSHEDLFFLTQAEGLSLDLTDISTEQKNRLSEIKGDIIDQSDSLEYKNLTSVGGNVSFPGLLNAGGLRQLTHVGGHALLPKLLSSKGLEKLAEVRGNALFIDLQEVENLTELRKIGGYAAFLNLKKSKGLRKLKEIGGNANFINLDDASDLIGLTEIGANANFLNLENSKGLSNLLEIGGVADFINLKSAEGLTSLRRIAGKANFLNLLDSVGLEALEEFGSDANLPNLRVATGLIELKKISGTANLLNLQNSTGLNNLVEIAGDANLPNLTNGRGLTGLRNIGGTANFLNLKDITGLEELEKIGRFEYFYQLVKQDKLRIRALRERYQ